MTQNVSTTMCACTKSRHRCVCLHRKSATPRNCTGGHYRYLCLHRGSALLCVLAHEVSTTMCTLLSNSPDPTRIHQDASSHRGIKLSLKWRMEGKKATHTHVRKHNRAHTDTHNKYYALAFTCRPFPRQCPPPTVTPRLCTMRAAVL